ncbi:MAG: nuclear transport factor 2 family protein [Alphaproteobacteria bacterium]|nr:nuclear transport factor 2 family protein [Alphaproteobacteria bacterium]
MANLAESLPRAEDLARGQASRRVLTFLRTMEKRDIATATAYFAPDFAMVFPGTGIMHSLDELFAYSAGRHRKTWKTFEGFDEGQTAEGTVVYCWGTLNGERVDTGAAYDGIRFLDRFTVAADGRFRDQTVWNDQGEYGIGKGNLPLPGPDRDRPDDRAAVGEASRFCLRYLRLMEETKYDAAKAMLAPGFWTVFPGDRRFSDIDILLESMLKRYPYPLKTFHRFDEAPAAGGGTIVYCYGTLRGKTLDGGDYAGIRFIDRMTVRGGKVLDQMVWNDRGECAGFAKSRVQQ